MQRTKAWFAAAALAVLPLAGTSAQASSPSYTPEQVAAIHAWDAAQRANEIRAWDIEKWNQAIVDAAGPYVSNDCRTATLYMQRVHGYTEYELRHWAYIAHRESLCLLFAHNTRPPDDSVCWYQINFYGSLRASRTAAFGPPSLLLSDPNACARAASAMYDGSGFQPWGG